MADAIRWEKEPDILALAKKDGFQLRKGRLAEWHRKGLLPEPKPIGLGKGKGTVTCYPVGTTKQVFDLLRLKHVYGRNFAMIGWILAMGGYEVDQCYWKNPVREVLHEWTCFNDFCEAEEDGSVHPSEELYESLAAADAQCTLRKSPLWLMLKRLRKQDRDTFFRVIAAVRLGNAAFIIDWDKSEAQRDLDIVGLALGLRRNKKRKEPLFWDGRILETSEMVRELEKLATKISEADIVTLVGSLSDDALLLGLRRFSLLVWMNRDRVVSSDHRFTRSAAATLYIEKPKRLACLATLGGFYFNLFDLKSN